MQHWENEAPVNQYFDIQPYELVFAKKPEGLPPKDEYEWDDAYTATLSGLGDTPIGQRNYVSPRFKNAVQAARDRGGDADRAVFNILKKMAAKTNQQQGGASSLTPQCKAPGYQAARTQWQTPQAS